MESTPNQINDLYREQVERARRQSVEEKFLDGLRLFDLACTLMADGIRFQHPDASEAEVLDAVRGRVNLLSHDRLDWAYLTEWCARHGTIDLLQDLRRGLPSQP